MYRYFCFLTVAALVSCNGPKSDSASSNTIVEKPSTDIRGQWMIENIVVNDSSYVRPSEIEPGLTAYINFNDDNTFGVMTNCNHMGGQYLQSDDSIQLSDISYTELACDNMEIEENLKLVLPIVNAIDCLNDSVVRINTSKDDSYIVLRKSVGSVK